MEKQSNPLDALLQGLASQSNAQEAQEENQEIDNTPVQEVDNSDSEESNEIESSSQEEEDENQTPVETTKLDKDNEVSDWDLDESDNDQEEPNSNVYKELGAELGLPIKDKNSVLEEVKRLKTEKETLTKQIEDSKSQKPFANDNLEKANEIAKSGGDYLAYLKISEINYDQVPNDALLEHAYAEDFDSVEDLKDYLDSMSEQDKKVRANQIKRELKQQQSSQQREIEQAVIQKKRQLDEGLTKHLESKDSMFGFKLKPSHKKEIYSDIQDGKLINEIFYKTDGSYNFEAMAEISFLRKNKDKLFDYLKSKTTNEVKREEFKKISNVEVTKKSSPVVDTTKKSGVEAYLEQLKSQKRF